MSQPKIFYDNRLDDGTPVASTTATGDYDVLNVRDMRPYTWHKGTALPFTITVDCGSAKTADYWAVYGHDLNTQAADIELRGSTDNFAASNVLIDSLTPADDEPFLREFNQASYRYWRFTVPAGATANPSFAILMVGDKLTLPVFVNEGFDPIGVKLVGNINRSQKGHPLGRVIQYEDWEQNLNFPLVTWAWLRSTWEPAWINNLRSKPFIFSWEHDNYAGEIRLVNIQGQYLTPHKAGAYADLVFTIAGVIRG